MSKKFNYSGAGIKGGIMKSEAQKQELIRISDFLEDLQYDCEDDLFDLVKSIVDDLDKLIVFMYPDPEDKEQE